MPTFILKPTREDDFYVAYCTITDSAVAWGTRGDFEYDPDPWYLRTDTSDIAARLDRAERTGTSDHFNGYPFDSGSLLVRWPAAGDREIGAHLIDRDKVRPWLENRDDALLQPVTA